mgnify:CR=1 FL=1|tara:strand:- start:452 stop:1384 length:933 start_codon:yes stop_codon:yes gene_type:complete
MENFLYFAEAVVETGDDGTSEALCVPASSFIGADPMSGATEFKFRDASGEGAHRVKFTHTAGKQKDVMRAFMACVNANPQEGQFIRVFDGETGTATTKDEFINPVFNGLGVSAVTIKEVSGETGAITGVSGGTTLSTSYGAGMVSTGTGAPGAPQYSRTMVADTIVTTVKIDLTGLGGVSDADDVIGIASGTPDAYFLKHVVNEMGVLYEVEMTCLELPASDSNNLTDINLACTSASTGGYNDDGNGYTQLLDAGTWTAGETQILTTAAVQTISGGDYFYLLEGATHTGANTWTAGAFMLTFKGAKLPVA